MNHVTFIEDMFKSIPVGRKIVSVLFSIKNDVDLLHKCGFLTNDKYRLCLEFKIFLLEQN